MRYRLNYTLYKRGKYWYYRAYTLEGKRTCGKSTGCTVKSKAILYCDELLKQGLLATVSGVSFKTYATGFFDEGSAWYIDRCSENQDGKMPLSYNSLKSMRSSLANHILPYWGRYKLSEITMSDIKHYRIKKLQEGCGVGTINLSLIYMRTIMEVARLDNLITSNPFQGVKYIQDTKEKKDAFTMDEIIVVCTKILPNKRVLLFFITALCTGMRSSELMAIRKETLMTDHVCCFDQRIRVKGGCKITQTKTGNKRFIPLCSKLYKLLIDSVDDTSFCFYIRDVDVVNKIIRDNCSSNSNITFHSTRRFFNTYMLAKNISPVKVAAVMGHKAGVSDMQDLYSNWKPEHFPEIAEQQEILLNEILEKLNITDL